MVDFSKVGAIDFHTHAEEPCNHACDGGYNEFQAGMAVHSGNPAGAEGMLRDTAVVIFPDDAERETGFRRYSNGEVAGLRAGNDDVPVPFSSIDPHKGKAGAGEVRCPVRDFGVSGFMFHPTAQGFFPDDRTTCYTVLEACAPECVITLLHTGRTGVGSGLRGGKDDAAVDFPDMPIILAHPFFLWTEEGLAVRLHKPNVHYDMSGWSPKYFPGILIRYANSIPKRKMPFGSDWPAITPDSRLADFAKVPFRDDVRSPILRENAMRLPGEADG